MDYVWTPWRYQYVSRAQPGDPCIFCSRTGSGRDREHFILHRGQRNFIILNRFPYTAGHLMVAPFEHVATLAQAPPETVTEMMLLARRADQLLAQIYKPEGMNLGINEGACAGAGVAGHLHMHVLPRWTGDASFMTTIAETRLLPEDLNTTYEKLRGAFAETSA
ncbi:MAG: HIT domain-containing protein [Acidobacteria bacterium]|nr:HIT domain-containing protein [Acidobacteriota bacterium]